MEFNKQQGQISEEDKAIAEAFKQLPQVIQDAILKSGWENQVRNLVKEYGLRIDQGTVLENMTFGVMLGMTEPEEYYKTIVQEFDLDTNKANSLFKDLDERVFNNIQGIIVALDQTAKNTPSDEEKKILDQPIKDDPEYTYSGVSLEDKDELPTRDQMFSGIEDKEHRVDTEAGIPPLPPDFSAGNTDSDKIKNAEAPKKPPMNDVPVNKKPEPIIIDPDSNSEVLDDNSVSFASPTINKADMPSVPPGGSVVPPPPPAPDMSMGKQSAVTNTPQDEKDLKPFNPDPVTAGLQNDIDTSATPKRDYKASGDPYREPIE